MKRSNVEMYKRVKEFGENSTNAAVTNYEDLDVIYSDKRTLFKKPYIIGLVTHVGAVYESDSGVLMRLYVLDNGLSELELSAPMGIFVGEEPKVNDYIELQIGANWYTELGAIKRNSVHSIQADTFKVLGRYDESVVPADKPEQGRKLGEQTVPDTPEELGKFFDDIGRILE